MVKGNEQEGTEITETRRKAQSQGFATKLLISASSVCSCKRTGGNGITETRRKSLIQVLASFDLCFPVSSPKKGNRRKRRHRDKREELDQVLQRSFDLCFLGSSCKKEE
jgi:hypothetical protein